MQFARNIVPAVLAAFCLALVAAGCGQKDNSAMPPPTGTPSIPKSMPLDVRAGANTQSAPGKPH